MSTLNLKTLLKSSTAMAALTLTLVATHSRPALARSADPFGIANDKPIAPELLEKNQSFSDTTDDRLDYLQKSEIDGDTAWSRIGKMMTELPGIVIDSDNDQPMPEYLTRFALVQGMQLTVGLPNPNGIGLREPGILSGRGNDEINAQILKDSISLARNYWMNGNKHLTSEQMLDQQINQYAGERLEIAQRRWLGVIGNNWRVAYAFEIGLLKQWRAAVNADFNGHKQEVEYEMKMIDSLLNSLPGPGVIQTWTDDELRDYVAGTLRAKTNWLTERMIKKFPCSDANGDRCTKFAD